MKPARLMTFEEWMAEIEGWASRSERMEVDFDLKAVYAVKWCRAAYEVGAEDMRARIVGLAINWFAPDQGVHADLHAADFIKQSRSLPINAAIKARDDDS